MKPSYQMSLRGALGLVVCGGFHAFAEGLDVEYQPLKFGAVQEFGSVNKMLLVSQPVQVLEGEWIDHFGAFFTQEALVNKRLDVKLGMGGVFQFPKPEKISTKYGGSLYKLFFVGPTAAKAMVLFGDPASPTFSVGGGMFPFKYNADAVDLGEYLFRSTPYPTTLMTGGLTFVNDNSAYLQGFHAALNMDDFHVDALLTTETGLPPLYDWSLGLLASYRVGGIFEIGAGAQWKRMISIDPDRTSWKSIYNATFVKNGKTYYGDPAYYSEQANFYNRLADSLTASGRSDSATARLRARENQAVVDSMNGYFDPGSGVVNGWYSDENQLDSIIPENTRNYFSTEGLILMARASVDLGAWLDMDPSRPFKIFTEAAILGWKNYPIFYEDRMQRAPIMLGAHLPTFGLLNQLTVQFEYFNSPWANNTRNLGGGGGGGDQNLAVPVIPSGTNPIFSRHEYNDLAKNDNYAWAILLRRELIPGFNLSAQLARDHMRTVGTNWFYGGRLEPVEVLYRNSAWYWMVHLSWGL